MATLIKIQNRIINAEKITFADYDKDDKRLSVAVVSEEGTINIRGDKARWLWQKLSHMCMYDYEQDKEDEEAIEELAN